MILLSGSLVRPFIIIIIIINSQLKLDLCLSGTVCEAKAQAIFFVTAGCKVILCCDNFHITLTAVWSGKGILWQHFHERSWIYRKVYRIYSISFVSLRSTDTDIMKFGRKRSVKTSRTWFGRRKKTDGQAETAFVKLNHIPCTSEGSVKW